MKPLAITMNVVLILAGILTLGARGLPADAADWIAVVLMIVTPTVSILALARRLPT